MSLPFLFPGDVEVINARERVPLVFTKNLLAGCEDSFPTGQFREQIVLLMHLDAKRAHCMLLRGRTCGLCYLIEWEVQYLWKLAALLFQYLWKLTAHYLWWLLFVVSCSCLWALR